MANDRTSVLFRQCGGLERARVDLKTGPNLDRKLARNRRNIFRGHGVSTAGQTALRTWGFATALGGGQPERLVRRPGPACSDTSGTHGAPSPARDGAPHTVRRPARPVLRPWLSARSAQLPVRSVPGPWLSRALGGQKLANRFEPRVVLRGPPQTTDSRLPTATTPAEPTEARSALIGSDSFRDTSRCGGKEETEPRIAPTRRWATRFGHEPWAGSVDRVPRPA